VLTQEIRHPNLIELVGSTSSNVTRGGQRAREFLFIFPYYGRGTVWDALARALKGGGAWPYSERQALLIFMGTCMGILEMHNRGYAHWDIKVRASTSGGLGFMMVDQKW
jgi:hypothetical protein